MFDRQPLSSFRRTETSGTLRRRRCKLSCVNSTPRRRRSDAGRSWKWSTARGSPTCRTPELSNFKVSGTIVQFFRDHSKQVKWRHANYDVISEIIWNWQLRQLVRQSLFTISPTRGVVRAKRTHKLVHLGWLLEFYDSTRDKDDTTVGVGHSRRYCNTGYDQSQGRRPSTLKCIGPISQRRYRAQPSVRN